MRKRFLNKNAIYLTQWGLSRMLGYGHSLIYIAIATRYQKKQQFDWFKEWSSVLSTNASMCCHYTDALAGNTFYLIKKTATKPVIVK